MSLGRLGLVQAGQPSKKCPTLAEMTADATATACRYYGWKDGVCTGREVEGHTRTRYQNRRGSGGD